mmetsp:Transcript_17303/g.58746  ORF Transcript_17303/g.58746 Transcript_17303/m.58746 type:complete len:195 (-) Transcript_17303:51-635(-)
MSSRGWLESYERIKRSLHSKRSTGAGFSANDVSSFDSQLRDLEQQLTAMEGRPTDYSLTNAELVRRKTLVSNLRKQLVAVQSGSQSTLSMAAHSDQALVQRQRDVMSLQDDMINDIEKGVDRLHDQARVIHDEARLHVGLLDQIDTDVENATTGLREEAKHAEAIREKSQTCAFYICIVVELVVLVLLLVFGFS